MIKVDNIKVRINYTDQDLRQAICRTMKVKMDDLLSYEIMRRSLDARKKPDLFYVFSLHVEVKLEDKVLKKNKHLKKADLYTYRYPTCSPLEERPIIVGLGPAGLFAAHVFAKAGLRPLVFEMGEAVQERSQTVEHFWKTGQLNPKSNVQYGEGGAGTFSDGKLTTRSKDPRARKVLEVLVDHGGPQEIVYSHKPHVGTDILKKVVVSMRNEIIDLGGEVHFSTQVEDLIIDQGRIKGVKTSKGDFYSGCVLLGIGNSGRAMYEVLHRHGIDLEQKPFAMGLRIEHQQSMIDLNQYGSLEARQYLGASDYKLTHKAANGRSVYSFCVCPGGMVVASASEEDGLVVNGMSEYKRDQENINSALLVQVQTEDFGSDHPLAGMYYQRKYEHKAFKLTQNFRGPVQTVAGFLNDRLDELGHISPSYRPGVSLAMLKECLPDFASRALKEALVAFGKKIKGFDQDDSVLTGLESRSSAPVRIVRDRESLESTSLGGLYPIGEGAGYAGGIVSAAIDGMRAAEAAIEAYGKR